GRLAPPLAEIVDPRATERLSPHVVVPVRAALFHFLLETRGAAVMRELWRGNARIAIDADLQRAIDVHWRAIDASYHDVFAEKRKERYASGATPQLQKGVGLEPASMEADRGYASRRCEQSLTDVKLL